MSSIAVIYDSGHGHTKRLAALITEGAGPTAWPLSVTDMDEADWPRLQSAKALIFGSPTYMGGVSAAFKHFMDASSDFWLKQPWHNKIAAGFTVGSYPSGDKLATLQHLAIFAAQHSMIWVGQSLIGPQPEPSRPREINADGSMLGLMATSSRDKSKLIDAGDSETARAFGQRVKHITEQFHRETSL